VITRETDYAIRALLRLAQQGEGAVVSTTILAHEMDIPYRFLRRILLKVCATGLVRSVRGKQGGLRLCQSPDTVTLLDIVRAVDEASILLNICLTDEHHCPRDETCVVHEVLGTIQEEVHRRFAGVTLGALAAEDKARGAQGRETV